jgi:hypothetical protein
MFLRANAHLSVPLLKNEKAERRIRRCYEKKRLVVDFRVRATDEFCIRAGQMHG